MIANTIAAIGILLLILFWWAVFQQFPPDAVADLNVTIVLISLVGGVLPALLWLWFWLKEDARKPEPASILLIAFLGGMIAVPFTMPFQQAAYSLAEQIQATHPAAFTATQLQAGVIILWAFIEEVIKFAAIYFIAFKSRFFDEPIDALIYLITGALGFAALENSLYLMTSLTDGGVAIGAMNTHLRFLGATLLHVVSSAAIGVAIAYSFYKKKRRLPYLIGGIFAATLLHAAFNLFIIETNTMIETVVVFSYYWVLVLVLIFLFESVKVLKPIAKNVIRLK